MNALMRSNFHKLLNYGDSPKRNKDVKYPNWDVVLGVPGKSKHTLPHA